MVILELIHAPKPDFAEGLCLLDTELTQAPPGLLVIHNNRTDRMAPAGDESFKFLTYLRWRRGIITMMVIMANIFPRWLIPRRPFLPRGFPAKRRVVLWGLEGPESDDWEAGLEGLEARHASSREMALGTGGS